MPKILYITSTLKRTGPNNVLYNLISELNREKFEPVILTLSAEDPNFPSLWGDFEDINVEIYSCNFSRIKGFISGKREISKFVKDHNIDAVHIYGFRGDCLVDSKISKSVVSTINSNIFDDYTMLYGKFTGRIMAYLHIRALKGKTSIACSQFVADELEQRYKIKLNVIYNGIPCKQYTLTSKTEKLDIRKELNLPKEKRIFIFVGYLIFRKDPITAIDGFLNSDISKNSLLLIIGDGPLMEDCKKRCVNLSESVMFLGNQPSTLAYLKASDFYISSAYSEGLPTSVMEAMGCGLPVILSDINPHKELVSSIKKWDYLFPINKPEILSERIKNITEDDYKELSEKCRNVIFNEINSTIMCSNYQLLYEK